MSATAPNLSPDLESIDVELDELESVDELLSSTSFFVEIEPDEGPSNVFLDPGSAGARDAFEGEALETSEWLDPALLVSADSALDLDPDTFVDPEMDEDAPDQSGQYPIQSFGRLPDSPVAPPTAQPANAAYEDDALDPPTIALDEVSEPLVSEPVPVDPWPLRLPQFSLADAARAMPRPQPVVMARAPRLPMFSFAADHGPRPSIPPVRLARFEIPERDLSWYEVMGTLSRRRR